MICFQLRGRAPEESLPGTYSSARTFSRVELNFTQLWVDQLQSHATGGLCTPAVSEAEMTRK